MEQWLLWLCVSFVGGGFGLLFFTLSMLKLRDEPHKVTIYILISLLSIESILNIFLGFAAIFIYAETIMHMWILYNVYSAFLHYGQWYIIAIYLNNKLTHFPNKLKTSFPACYAYAGYILLSCFCILAFLVYSNAEGQLFVEVTVSLYQSYLNWPFVAMLIIFIIYFFQILILFKHNLNTLNYANDDEEMLKEQKINLKYYIVKHINLIWWLIFLSLIYGSILIMNAHRYIQPDHSTLLFIILSQFYTISFCQYLCIIVINLTFIDCNKCYKNVMCRFCHWICRCICAHSCKINKESDNVPLLIAENADVEKTFQLLDNVLSSNDDRSHRTCNKKVKCKSVQVICDMLHEYDRINGNVDDLLNYLSSMGVSLSKVLNEFDHLLLCHDSDKDFKEIYKKLNKSNEHCSYIECKPFNRNYSRRLQSTYNKNGKREDDEHKHKEKEFNILENVVDKIHSFYLHSYDTFARNNILNQTPAEKIQTVQKLSAQNDDTFSNNDKFTSNFNITDVNRNNSKDNINVFSFGQRFEYENKEKEWFVDAKYDTFKNELINNKLCNISLSEFNIEYNKCMEYMKTNRIRALKNVIKKKPFQWFYLLSLLIYCNCDNYQNKWSASYRFINKKETNLSLKNRHSFFYFSSKYLRVLVECFGEKLINNKCKTFYHGLCEILYFTETNTQFH
eukprot:442971_1